MTERIDKRDRKILFKIGIVLLIFACLSWACIVAVPFLPISNLAKASVVGFLLIVGEVTFWLGAACTGKELIQNYRKYLNPRNWKSKCQ